MSRRKGEFEHRTSIFEGAFRAWCFLGQLQPSEIYAKRADEFNPLIARDKEGTPLSTVDGRSSAGDDYVYEPLPRKGLAHPFVKAILRPWLGPDADSEAMELGLTTLRTWWQHRRKGESGTAINALGTDRMRAVVDGYTRHFFTLAYVLIFHEQEQPPRGLQSKMERGRLPAISTVTRMDSRGSSSGATRNKSITLPVALTNANPNASSSTRQASVGQFLNNNSAGLIRGFPPGSSALGGPGMGGYGREMMSAGVVVGNMNGMDTGYNGHSSRGSFPSELTQRPKYGNTTAAPWYYNTPMDSDINMYEDRYGATNVTTASGMMPYGAGPGIGLSNYSSMTGSLEQGPRQRLSLRDSAYGLDSNSSLLLAQQQLYRNGYTYGGSIEDEEISHTAKRRRSDHSLSLINELNNNAMVAELANHSMASQRAFHGADMSKSLRQQNAISASLDGPQRHQQLQGDGLSNGVLPTSKPSAIDKAATSEGCCSTNNTSTAYSGSVSNNSGIDRMPVVFVNQNQDIQIGIEVRGMNDIYCVKIIERVLRGPSVSSGETSKTQTPIEGLIDAVADKALNFVLIKIDKSSNAKRIAAEAVRNLSLVGYSGKVKDMAVTELLDAANSSAEKQGTGSDISTLFGAFEAVGSSDARKDEVFKWGVACSCFNGSEEEDCCRHSQMTRSVFDLFQDREKQVKEYMKGCLMRYGGDCSCDSNCVCPGCPIHDPKLLENKSKNPCPSASSSKNFTNVLAEAAAQISQQGNRQFKGRSGRAARVGNRTSFTMRGSGPRASFGRAMSGLSNISIDWDNMEDFDVNVDHSANVVHNNLQVAEGCNMENGGECNCATDNCKCKGCTHCNAPVAKEESTDSQSNINTPNHQRRRSSLRKLRDNEKIDAVSNNEPSVSFKL